jgi:hypothetical protein
VGKAIGYGVLIMLVFGGWSFMMIMAGFSLHEGQMKRDGLAGARGRMLLKSAARIMGGIGISPSIDDPEIIRPVTRDAIDKWIKDYYKETEAT